MKVLVTGATGFIGKYLVDELSPAHEVAALVLPGESVANDRLSRVFRGDITAPSSLLQACSWPNIVIHAAGLTKALRTGDYFRINARGTRHVVDAVSRVNPNLVRFIFFSSIAATGPAQGTQNPLTEEHEPRAIDAYGASKLVAERIIQKSRLPSTILRLPSIYGGGSAEYQIYLKLAARRIRLVPDFRNVPFSLLHAGDLARCISRLIEGIDRAEPLYFLSDGRTHSFHNLSENVARLFPGRHLSIRIPRFYLHVAGSLMSVIAKLSRKAVYLNAERARILHHPYLCSSEKFRNQFNLKTMMTLEEGLRQSLGWYRSMSRARRVVPPGDTTSARPLSHGPEKPDGNPAPAPLLRS